MTAKERQFRKRVSVNLLIARKGRGYTQKQLAIEVGVCRPHICDIERGRYLPSLFLYAELVKVLEIDILPQD